MYNVHLTSNLIFKKGKAGVALKSKQAFHAHTWTVSAAEQKAPRQDFELRSRNFLIKEVSFFFFFLQKRSSARLRAVITVFIIEEVFFLLKKARRRDFELRSQNFLSKKFSFFKKEPRQDFELRSRNFGSSSFRARSYHIFSGKF